MKKLFGFGSKGRSPSEPAGPRRACVGRQGAHDPRAPRYRLRDRDLGKIHKAASAGDSARVQHLLILGKNGVNDRDRKRRTPLHFACAYGHPEVVTLLVERKCDVDACDSENSTALIKAVQCQEEKCVAILLDHGADADAADTHGNTALHYAVYTENTSVAAKLLAHGADTEAKNKDGLTPLLLALRENKQQVAELLGKKEADTHMVDKPGRVSSKPGPDDSWPTSDEDDYNFDTKKEATELVVREEENGTRISENASQGQTDNHNFTYVDGGHRDYKSDMMSALGLGEEEESPWDSESLSESIPQKCNDHFSGATDQRAKNREDGQVEDMVYIPSCMSGSRNLKMAKLEDTRNVGIPVAHKESPGIYPHVKDRDKRKHQSQEVEVSENQGGDTVVAGGDGGGLVKQTRSRRTGNQQFPLEEKEEHDGPTKKTSNENKVNKQIDPVDDLDDLTQSSETASEDSELPYPKYESVLLLFEQLRMECKDSISVLKIWDAVHSYKRLIELKNNHYELLIGKIKKLENNVSGLQKELTETKEAKSQLQHEKVEMEGELCNLRFALKQEEEKRKIAYQFYEQIKEQLRKKEEQYNEEVEAKQQLEVSFRTLDMELKTVRSKLNQVLEEQNVTQRQLSQEQNARILQDGILANHLSKQKEIQMAQEKMSSEIFFHHEKEKDLLHKNDRLHDEIAVVSLEIDTMKNLNQEKEKKYREDIEIANEKNDDLQRSIKLNEETFTKTIFQYNGQLSVLTVENTVLNSKLENEKQNKERLETEVESYRSRLAAAEHDYKESQTSKRDLELAFQRARDEWFRLQDKMNFDISELKDNNEILSQQLSKAERKFSSLEIELHHTREALREKTLVLEQVQRDLNQTQCQMKEVEHMYQNEQGRVNKYIGKQESIEERLSQLQSENTLLRQQLDDAHNKVDSKEKTVINMQDQFHDIVKKLQAENEKQAHLLEDRNKELINECNHLKERLYHYENEKAEREVVVRQLQQELADTLKKQSMSEASLEVSTRYRISLEDETQNLKKKLGQITSQLQEERERHTEAERCAQRMQDHLQKLELENSKLKVMVKKQTGKVEQLQKNLLSANLSEDEKERLKKLNELKQSLEYTLDQEKKKNGELEKELTGFKKLLKMTQTKLNEDESGEFNFHGGLKNEFEMDISIHMLIHKIDDLAAKLEIASSKCLHLDKNNQLLQQEILSMKTIQKKCEKLQKNKKKLEQEVVNLKSHIERNMVEQGRVEQYMQEIEERARQDLVGKLKQVNLFLQTQAASQENLEQLRESNNASIRSQMELRINDLESELSKMKAQEDANKIQLEKYKQLYVEEFKIRKALSNKLNNLHKANERLEETNARLLTEKQQSRSLLGPVGAGPVPDYPCTGNLNNSLMLNRTFIPRESSVAPTSNPRPSNKSMENYLSKMRQELEKSITRELKEAAAELESGFRISPVGSTSKSSQDLLSEASQEYAEILKKKYML
ncbi:ankyrin repeat domain-containing protein 26-like [Ctenodactylus gundi]